MDMQTYAAQLKVWAEEETKLAQEAQEEREKSIHLMLASMYGPMLTQLGRVGIEGIRPDALAKVAEDLKKKAEICRQVGDFDMEEREGIKLAAVRRAMALLEE